MHLCKNFSVRHRRRLLFNLVFHFCFSFVFVFSVFHFSHASPESDVELSAPTFSSARRSGRFIGATLWANVFLRQVRD
jgi:hypothetical protein